MKTDELQKILQRLCGDVFMGVFPSNHLPHPSREGIFVVNTDACNRPGEHWICIFVGLDGKGEFFDSFGRPPDGVFLSYMNMHCRRWTYNSLQLQSIASRLCGHYCIFYCAYHCKNFNVHTIASWFTSDTGLNDVLVHEFVCARLKTLL